MDLNNIKEKNQLFNIIAFAILMENGEGILSKSPDYILEKFNRYTKSEESEWGWGMDDSYKKKFIQYVKKWIAQKVE